MTVSIKKTEHTALDQHRGQAAAASTTGLTLGQHTLFVEALDGSGAWGAPTAIFFTIGVEETPTDTPEPTVPPITLQYFYLPLISNDL